MAKIRVAMEFGMGTSLRRADYTKAAVRALSDALWHNSLSMAEAFGFDKSDIQYYNKIFNQKLPTDIELFDLAQSNSEHCRHHFFNGDLYLGDIKAVRTNLADYSKL